jgi:adenylate cyclase
MNDAELKQRLAGILVADVAGYSRLMAVDERATVAALDAGRSVFRAVIESHRGRVIDMAGDSVLAVFETAIGAVTAALAIQENLGAAAGAVPEDKRMRFRIGVHLGDVIEKADGTIYGDGVNIAARLQALATPGNVMVSDAVQGAVRGKVTASFDDQGEQTVKNIPYPVRAFAVRTEGAATAQPPPAAGEAQVTLPDKASIAVLPFTNMSGDPEQEYFADGLTEDIITEMSRFRTLIVMARNSTFTYKGRAVDVRTVSKELAVRYVLEGSIRRTGNRIRVTAQLIDALGGNHIWAEKFDRSLEDVFAVQEELTQAIVTAVNPQIEAAERKRVHESRPEKLSAHEIAMHAWAAVVDSRPEALRLGREALAIDPRCSSALRVIACTNWQDIFFSTAASVEDANAEGLDAAARAIFVDHEDHVAYLWKGALLFQSGHEDIGLSDMRRAYELNPNGSLTLATLGFHEAMSGNASKGIEYIERALRLSPRDPLRFLFLGMLGWAHFAVADYEKGVDSAQRSVADSQATAFSHLCLLVNCAGAAKLERAKAELRTLQSIAPEMVEARLAGQWPSTNIEMWDRATHLLRITAGLEQPGAAAA